MRIFGRARWRDRMDRRMDELRRRIVHLERAVGLDPHGPDQEFHGIYGPTDDTLEERLRDLEHRVSTVEGAKSVKEK